MAPQYFKMKHSFEYQEESTFIFDVEISSFLHTTDHRCRNLILPKLNFSFCSLRKAFDLKIATFNFLLSIAHVDLIHLGFFANFDS